MNGPADNNLDFLSTLAVILCSAAITIFLFWLSSRLVGLQILENLPSFITGAYSGIWTAAAAGTAGIGLGIVKALTSKDRPQPNYLKWILIVTGLFLAITIVLTGGLYAFSRYMDSKKSATPAQTSSTQAVTSQASDKTDTTKAPSVATPVHPAVAPQGTDTSPPSGVEKISDIPNSNTGFDLETQDGVSPLDVTISGTMRMNGNSLFLVVGDAGITLQSSAAAVSVTRIAMKVCEYSQAAASGTMIVYPKTSHAADALTKRITVAGSDPVMMGNMSFQIRDIDKGLIDRGWLCAAIYTRDSPNPLIAE